MIQLPNVANSLKAIERWINHLKAQGLTQKGKNLQVVQLGTTDSIKNQT